MQKSKKVLLAAIIGIFSATAWTAVKADEIDNDEESMTYVTLL